MTRVELTECGRTVAGDLVAFDLQWEGEASGEVVWAVRISSPDQSEALELVVARRDDTLQQYVSGERGRQDVEPDADVSDHHVTARFPAGQVGVAAEWPVWTAVIAVDGEVVAEQVIPTG